MAARARAVARSQRSADRGQRVFRECGDEIPARRLERRQHPDGQSRHDRRAEAEERHPRVQRHVVETRKVVRQHGRQSALHHGREREPGGAAEQTEQQVFDEALPRQPPGSGAERRPNGELTPAARRARQLQARDVGRGGREQEQHGGEQHEDRGPHACDQIREQGRRGHFDGPVAPVDRHRDDLDHAFDRHRSAARLALRRRLLGRHAGTQSSEGVEQ